MLHMQAIPESGVRSTKNDTNATNGAVAPSSKNPGMNGNHGAPRLAASKDSHAPTLHRMLTPAPLTAARRAI